MSNYPAGVYDCLKCGHIVETGHSCSQDFRQFEVFYSKDAGKEWFLVEEHSNRDKALKVAKELNDDGFDSQVVESGCNIIFEHILNRKMSA